MAQLRVPAAAGRRRPGRERGLPQACRIGSSAWALQFHPEVSAAGTRHWIDDYRSDEDAVRIGLDPAPLRAETEAKIAAFNQLGRDLCRRWLDLAQT